MSAAATARFLTGKQSLWFCAGLRTGRVQDEMWMAPSGAALGVQERYRWWLGLGGGGKRGRCARTEDISKIRWAGLGSGGPGQGAGGAGDVKRTSHGLGWYDICSNRPHGEHLVIEKEHESEGPSRNLSASLGLLCRALTHW